VAVAEELNFSRAARRLNLSQPPLSRQIQSLEGKLGCRLFERNTRSVRLSNAGQMLLMDARRLLNELDVATQAVRRADAGETSRLRLGFVGALLDEELVELLQRFRDLYPRCQVHLTDLTPTPQLAALMDGKLDGAFIGAHPRDLRKGCKALVWKREQLMVTIPQRHVLANEKVLRFAQLREERWVMVSRESAPTFRSQFDEWCAKAKFRPMIAQESERLAAVLTMVAANHGISLLPASAQKLLGSGVSFVPLLAGRSQPVLEHAFVYRRPVTMELLRFVELLQRLNQRAGNHRRRKLTQDAAQ